MENEWRREGFVAEGRGGAMKTSGVGQYLSVAQKDIERTKQNPIALFGFTDHNSTPAQSKRFLDDVALVSS